MQWAGHIIHICRVTRCHAGSLLASAWDRARQSGMSHHCSRVYGPRLAPARPPPPALKRSQDRPRLRRPALWRRSDATRGVDGGHAAAL
eukprot:365329-Prymnesium_polylepis.1